MGFGVQELLIIFFIILLLFGAKKLPELASGLGKGIREFKKASTGADEIDEKQIEQPKSQEKAEQS
jgi:sec-independent protein translocase protein TatA